MLFAHFEEHSAKQSKNKHGEQVHIPLRLNYAVRQYAQSSHAESGNQPNCAGDEEQRPLFYKKHSIPSIYFAANTLLRCYIFCQIHF